MSADTAAYRALKTLGVPASLIGYGYLKDAIVMVHNSPETLRQMTKKLYPSIAAENNTTASRVERAIRHAIEYAYSNTDPSIIREYFGNVCNINSGKLTNSQFIAGLVQFIKMEGLV